MQFPPRYDPFDPTDSPDNEPESLPACHTPPLQVTENTTALELDHIHKNMDSCRCAAHPPTCFFVNSIRSPPPHYIDSLLSPPHLRLGLKRHHHLPLHILPNRQQECIYRFLKKKFKGCSRNYSLYLGFPTSTKNIRRLS